MKLVLLLKLYLKTNVGLDVIITRETKSEMRFLV